MEKYKYTGPTMLLGENEFRLKKGMEVLAEVNTNIAKVRVYLRMPFCPNPKELEVDVAAEYLEPVKPDTIHFDPKDDSHFFDKAFEAIGKLNGMCKKSSLQERIADEWKKLLDKQWAEKYGDDDFVDVLYEILRKTSTKFGHPFPDESCADDCKKALKKDLIDKFGKPSEDVLDIIRRMSREQSDDHHEVGGTHYKMAIEPWDFIYANHIPFDESCIIKYACRHKQKNGAEDIKKIISYAKHILKTQYGEELDKG